MSLLIKNVQIIDGEGGHPYKAEVYVQGDTILAVGGLKNKEADEVIDGLGDYLTPGFIDIDTDSDHYLDLFTNPKQNDFINQGITTIIGGQRGSSLAPLIYGTLESVKQWGATSQINVNWHTTAEFLAVLDKMPLGVNFGTLTGNTTIRRALAGNVQRKLTKNEIEIFKRVLRQTIKEGAFGLSTSLDYIHGGAASEKEVKELAGVLKELNAIHSIHLRNRTEKLLNSVEEAVRIANYSEAKTIISHFQPIIGFEEQFREAIELIKKNSKNLYFDICPRETSAEPIYMLLPKWARADDIKSMLENIEKPDIREKIEKELDKKINSREVQIANAPQNKFLIGKTVSQISENRNLGAGKGLIELMRMTGLNATVIFRNINYNELVKVLADDRAFISSGGAFLPKNFPERESSANIFHNFLETVLKNNLMPLEKAVKKITFVPAHFLNLKNRGVIKEGKIADMVIMDKNDYKIKEVILRGIPQFGLTRLAINRPGQVSAERKGEILRHKAGQWR